jgi:hypothetical protein
MTVPDYWAEGDFDGEGEAFESEMTSQLAPEVVPVRVIETLTENVPPEFAGMMTWNIPQSPGYIQVAGRSYERYKLKWWINFPGAGTVTLNTKIDPLTNPYPQGAAITAAAAGMVPIPEYDAQQPVYATASIAGVTISTVDERFGKVQ